MMLKKIGEFVSRLFRTDLKAPVVPEVAETIAVPAPQPVPEKKTVSKRSGRGYVNRKPTVYTQDVSASIEQMVLKGWTNEEIAQALDLNLSSLTQVAGNFRVKHFLSGSSKRRIVSREQVHNIHLMRQRGMSYKEIGVVLGLEPGQASIAYRRAQRTGEIK